MQVLIVGRTRMGDGRCIGGWTDELGSVRLLPELNSAWSASAPFQIGDVWDMELSRISQPRPPHVEDVIVRGSFSHRGVIEELGSAIRAHLPVWEGACQVLFDGCVRYTGAGNGYISSSRIPRCSTGFWIPDRDLVLRADGRHYDYVDVFGQKRGLAYVGEAAPLAFISAGTLTRVSLARWWRPDGVEDLGERCYLQLSGWF